MPGRDSPIVSRVEPHGDIRALGPLFGIRISGGSLPKKGIQSILLVDLGWMGCMF